METYISKHGSEITRMTFEQTGLRPPGASEKQLKIQEENRKRWALEDAKK